MLAPFVAGGLKEPPVLGDSNVRIISLLERHQTFFGTAELRRALPRQCCRGPPFLLIV